MASLKGGDKLVAHLAELAAKVSKAATLSVGVMEDATYPDGTPVALVAATNEFGRPSVGQPPRPAFRNAIAEHGDSWGGIAADLLKANGYDAEVTLNQMGEGIKGQIQDSIRSLTAPPLKASTIARKGFDKPLIDTGHEIASIDYKVE